MPHYKHGFTLIELMIVVAIIGIMATIALPTYTDRIIRAQVGDAMVLAERIREAVGEFYEQKRRFPKDNAEVGVPKPEHLIGNYVAGIHVREGAIHVTLGNRINAHVRGKILSLRPAAVIDSPESTISWLCGYADAVDGMQAYGVNETDIDKIFLPVPCRGW